MTPIPQFVRSPTHRYPEVGVCIYCGSTNQLEDEHIVPFGLGGNAILPAASCRTCAVVTSRFELSVLRGPMRPIRVALGVAYEAQGSADAPPTAREARR
jgi:HNH endonuclease